MIDQVGPGMFGHGPHAGGLLTDRASSLRHLITLFAGHEVRRSWGEPVMPPEPAATPDVLMMVMSHLNMLVCTGGKERTEPEFRALLTGAGFEVVSITPVPGPTNFSVIEAAPSR